MTTQHAIPDRDMQNRYFNEYFRKATAERKGFFGMVNRFFGDESAEAKLIVGGVAMGLPVSFLAPVLFPVYGQTLAVLAALGGGLICVAAHIAVSRDANKAMKADIASGVLGQRYAEEVLKPQQQRLQNTITALSSLPAKNPAADSFNAGVAEKSADKKVPAGNKKASGHRPKL